MQKLKRYLKRPGMNQNRLAIRLGVNRSVVHHWLNGRKPSGKYLIALSRVTGIKIEDLL